VSKLIHAARRFGAGTFLPERRASERPIAIACFGLVTFLPVPLFSLPRLNSCISFFTFLPAEGEYLRPDEDFFEADFLLLDFLLLELFFAEDFFVDVLRALPLLRVLLVFFALLFRALLRTFLPGCLLCCHTLSSLEVRWCRDSRQLYGVQATEFELHARNLPN
jgi:hypothetical protein